MQARIFRWYKEWYWILYQRKMWPNKEITCLTTECKLGKHTNFEFLPYMAALSGHVYANENASWMGSFDRFPTLNIYSYEYACETLKNRS